jgi:hypothetical protein
MKTQFSVGIATALIIAMTSCGNGKTQNDTSSDHAAVGTAQTSPAPAKKDTTSISVGKNGASVQTGKANVSVGKSGTQVETKDVKVKVGDSNGK